MIATLDRLARVSLPARLRALGFADIADQVAAWKLAGLAELDDLRSGLRSVRHAIYVRACAGAAAALAITDDAARLVARRERDAALGRAGTAIGLVEVAAQWVQTAHEPAHPMLTRHQRETIARRILADHERLLAD